MADPYRYDDWNGYHGEDRGRDDDRFDDRDRKYEARQALREARGRDRDYDEDNYRRGRSRSRAEYERDENERGRGFYGRSRRSEASTLDSEYSGGGDYDGGYAPGLKRYRVGGGLGRFSGLPKHDRRRSRERYGPEHDEAYGERYDEDYGRRYDRDEGRYESHRGGRPYDGAYGPEVRDNGDYERGLARKARRSHRGKGPKGYARSDERLLEDVNDRMTDDHYLDAEDITASASGGEVTLDGTVETRAEKRHAEDMIHDLSGVRHVQNNLRVRELTGESRRNAADETA